MVRGVIKKMWDICRLSDVFNCWSTSNLDPPPTHDNSHTLSVPYVFNFQYGTVSVCGLSFIGGGRGEGVQSRSGSAIKHVLSDTTKVKGVDI